MCIRDSLYKESICVSGTHGKTTTTSMITTALELAGRDPSAVIGGKLPLINGYGKAGKGDDIVIEACEFAETFLKLTPYLSVVLNIDNDHLDLSLIHICSTPRVERLWLSCTNSLSMPASANWSFW